MLRTHKNTKKQGDAGLGSAIAWYTSQGYTVNVPLTDSQDYDLIVDSGSTLIRVQVKTTTFKVPSGVFMVSLTVKGGNRSGSGKIKPFNKSSVDALFVVTGSGTRYHIPTRSISSASKIHLGKPYDQFIV